MINKNDCIYFEGCSATLCPYLSDPQQPWYPKEKICRRVKGIPRWVKQQKKIEEKVKPENYRYCFTLDMLKKNFRVTDAVKGIDPDKPEKSLKAWHKRYKGIKPRNLTPQQRQQKRQILKLARKAKLKKDKDNKKLAA